MSEIETGHDVDLEMQNTAPLLASPYNYSSSLREKLHILILVIQSSLHFTAGENESETPAEEPSPEPLSRVSSSIHTASVNDDADETARMANMDPSCDIAVEDQSCPLLVTPENITPSSRHAMTTLMHVLYSCLIFKAGGNVSVAQRSPSLSRVSSSTAAYTPVGSSDAIETDREVLEVEDDDSLSTSSEYGLTVPQTNRNETTGIQLQRCQSTNISKIVREKNLALLHDFGSIEGVADGLNTDLEIGIPGDTEDICRRKQKANRKKQIPALGICHFVLEAINNITIFLLLLAAVLSFGFGIEEEGLENGWYDGAILLFTIFILVIFTSMNNYWDEQRAQKKLEKQKVPNETEMEVHVIRGGIHQQIICSDLVHGDVVLLKKGYQVPADGLFIVGRDLKLDAGSNFGRIDEHNPFLFMGARVINGDARMVVTSVDMNTSWSEMMSKVTNSPDRKSNLEVYLNKLTTCMHNTGLVITILIIIVLFLRYIFRKLDDENGFRSESKAEPTPMSSFMNSFKRIEESRCTARALTKLLSVSLVGITEGIPYVVSVAVMYWNYKIFSGKATEQDSLACAKMASVTVICTDKCGELTEHQMEVDKFVIGKEFIRGCSMLFPNVLESLCDGIGTLVLKHQGAYNSMEESILSWAEDKLGLEREIMGQSWTIFKQMGMKPSEEPCGVLMGRIGQSGKRMYLHWNGPAKAILEMCTHYYDSKGKENPINDQERSFLSKTNEDMVQKKLKTIAFACKCTETRTIEAKDLILVGLLGLKDTKQEDTRKAIEECREREVKTILVSGDDVSALKTIAHQRGLITGDSEAQILTGEVFRNFTDKERKEKVDKVCVMGNALPNDKLLLVQCLRQKGEVVAVLGQRTSDAPALKEADIGIAMGTWSSKKATESSDIIISDESFSYLISMINSGKCIYENTQKFFQPVLIMTIASTMINFIGTISLGDAPLSTVQLIWVNLLVVFLGGLALLTGPLTDEPVSFPPISRTESFITMDMARNIATQVLYQVICLLTLQHKGCEIVGASQKAIKSMIFNSFVLCQFFNQFNARGLKKKNFFKGIHQNKWFWVALVAFTVLNGIFVTIQAILGLSTSLNWKLWTGCFLIGAFSWLIDWVGKWFGGLMMNFATKLHRFLSARIFIARSNYPQDHKPNPSAAPSPPSSPLVRPESSIIPLQI